MTSILDLTGAPVGSEIYLRISQGGNNGEPYIDNLSSLVTVTVPEPSTCAMAALGLLGLSFFGHRRKRS